MSTESVPATIGARERALIMGDLKSLSEAERTAYYLSVCESLGLNPATQPFAYITLSGRLTLYARRDATDQLRRLHGVSIVSLTEEVREGVYIVTATARDKAGRVDVSKGAVTIQGQKGDALANSIMKAETKAKRRVTLSLCGLGYLDETELETIHEAAPQPAPTVRQLEHQAAPPTPPAPAAPANGDDLDQPIGQEMAIRLRDRCAQLGWPHDGPNGWLAWLGWHPTRPAAEITRRQAQAVQARAHSLAALRRAGVQTPAPTPAAPPAPASAAPAAPADPLVTVEQALQLEDELHRAGRDAAAVWRRLRCDPHPRGIEGLTVGQWRTVMDSLAQMPDASAAPGASPGS